MSAEDKPTVDDDDSVSILDVLAQQSRMQEDASAVLGGSDDRECTHVQGYIQRQALYACSTCSTTEPAGICLACTYHCHEGHDLYELYTKRRFRCDCGNSKFPDTNCKLAPKTGLNEENKYNQNFTGVYCTCSRPYPDPEDEIEDEMIQCVVCEDWYHGRHLGTVIPENDSYQEMICGACMDQHPFLWAYQVTSPEETVLNDSAGDEKIDVEGGNTAEPKADQSEPTDKQSPVKTEPPRPVKEESGTSAGKDEPPESAVGEKRKIDAVSSAGNSSDVDSEPPAKRPRKGAQVQRDPGSQCMLLALQKREYREGQGAAFWPEGWRDQLCKCSPCQFMYMDEGVAYLMDKGDTVSAYEETGRSREQPVSEQDQVKAALSGMNRVQQIEMVNGFNDLKSELTEFLKGFADTGKVVSSEDIKEFFAHMEKRKKERQSAIPYLCK